MIRIACAVAFTLLLAAPMAAAQSVCRTGALGSVGCLGTSIAPPPPRQPADTPRDGLEAVLERTPPEAFGRDLIPARRTNSFGDTLLERGEGDATGGPCRHDALGHLRCR